MSEDQNETKYDKRNPGTGEVKIAEQSLVCSFDGSASPAISKVHDLLHGLLDKWLESRWGDPNSIRFIDFHLD